MVGCLQGLFCGPEISIGIESLNYNPRIFYNSVLQTELGVGKVIGGCPGLEMFVKSEMEMADHKFRDMKPGTCTYILDT